MIRVIIDIVAMLILIAILAYPVMNTWNGGIVKAILIAQPITYFQSMHITGIIFISAIINNMIKEWPKP